MNLKSHFTVLFIILSQVLFAQQNISKTFDKGNKLIEKKEYVKAIDTFSEVINLDSTESAAYFNRGWAYYRIDKPEKALIDFQKYHEMEPEDKEGMDMISRMYYQMDDYENLITSIKKFIEKGSTEYNSNLYLGYAYLKLDKYQEALEFLNYHLQLDSEDEEALMTRAEVYVMMERLKEAEADLSKLIVLNPKYHKALLIRGTIKATKEDYWGALEDLNKAIELSPSNYTPYSVRGDIYSSLSKRDEAKLDYEKAIQLSGGKDLEAFNSMGNLQMDDFSDNKEALKYFDLLLSKDSLEEYNHAYFTRGIVNMRLGNLDAAEKDFNKYSTTDTTQNNELNYYQADLEYRKGDLNKAAELIELYLSRPADFDDNDYAAAYQLQGKLLIAEKKFEQAMPLIEKSIMLDAADGETQYWKGIVLKNMKQNEKACDAFKKAFELEYDAAETELRELCGYSGSDDEDVSDSLVG